MNQSMSELALVIVLAAALGILAKLLRQPTILAYLAAGVVIGVFSFFNFDNREFFQIFSNLGIMFLLFLVGLEINYTSLKIVGKASVLVGLGQIIFTALFGFLISTMLGFNVLHSFYIAVALTFSSTIIVVQLLSEKKALNSLYGKLSTGFLLVQDFVAILILIFLAGLEKGEASLSGLALTVGAGILLFALMVFLGRTIIPAIFDKIAHSRELLFISSLAWLFAFVAVVQEIGFSVEIGGFLAGIALANSSEQFEISSRIKSLRDFFIVVFFAILGSSIALANFSGLIVPIVVLSLFVLIGNPLIVLIIMSRLGYEKRTSFLAGLTVAQISEFSLILAALGLKIGHLNDEVVGVITAVGVITITVSTYLITYANEIFRWLSPYLGFFEKKNLTEPKIPSGGLSGKFIIVGAHRTGMGILEHLNKKDVLVIDFDSAVIKNLKSKGYKAIFGDISDVNLLEAIDFTPVKAVVSTSPDLEDNLILLSKINRLTPAPQVVVRAESSIEAKKLYEKGADYVLIPEFISGHYIGMILNNDPELKHFEALKKRDLALY